MIYTIVTKGLELRFIETKQIKCQGKLRNTYILTCIVKTNISEGLCMQSWL